MMKNVNRSGFLVLLIIFCFGCLAGCSFNWLFGGGDLNDDVEETTSASVLSFESTDTRVQIIDKYLDACVSVLVLNATNSTISTGSGVAVAAGGFVATNYHCIQDVFTAGNKITVVHHGQSSGHAATLYWYSSDLDLALIKCSCADIPYAPMKDRLFDCADGEKLRQGEDVIAIGTPINIGLQNTTTCGVVSGLGRNSASKLSSGYRVYHDLIQIDAAINKGNSGGALVDSKGYLIGLNTLGQEDKICIGYAIPIYPIMQIISKVAAFTPTSTNKYYLEHTLGVDGYDALYSSYDNDVPEFDDEGYKITSSSKYSALKTGDIIKSIQIGTTVYEIDNCYDLFYLSLIFNTNDNLTITVERSVFLSPTTLTVNITIV